MVVQCKNWLTCCQYNVTGRDIIRLCLACDISVSEHYKALERFILSVTAEITGPYLSQNENVQGHTEVWIKG